MLHMTSFWWIWSKRMETEQIVVLQVTRLWSHIQCLYFKNIFKSLRLRVQVRAARSLCSVQTESVPSLLLSWWGTYQEENETVTFGLVTPIATLNPIKIQFAGYAWLWKRLSSTSNWLDKINYLWRPPEWQHSTKQSSHLEPSLAKLSSTEKL